MFLFFETLLTQFPKKPFYRKDWQQEPWRRAPLDQRFEDHLSFALSDDYEATEQSRQRDAHFEAIRKALAGSDAYYAFFHYPHGEHTGNIDFFLVDLANNKLYIINHNT